MDECGLLGSATCYLRLRHLEVSHPQYFPRVSLGRDNTKTHAQELRRRSQTIRMLCDGIDAICSPSSTSFVPRDDATTTRGFQKAFPEDTIQFFFGGNSQLNSILHLLMQRWHSHQILTFSFFQAIAEAAITIAIK